MTSSPAIRTRGLTRRFGALVATDGVDYEVPAGSVSALIGPNGAGKTTLLSLLCGYLKPTAGSGTVLGRPLGDVAGVKSRLMKLPKSAMFAYGGAAERVSDRFTHKEPVITYAAAQSAAQYCYFENTKVREELGLTFRPLEETLRDSIDWFRKIGMIQ